MFATLRFVFPSRAERRDPPRSAGIEVGEDRCAAEADRDHQVQQDEKDSGDNRRARFAPEQHERRSEAAAEADDCGGHAERGRLMFVGTDSDDHEREHGRDERENQRKRDGLARRLGKRGRR